MYIHFDFLISAPHLHAINKRRCREWPAVTNEKWVDFSWLFPTFFVFFRITFLFLKESKIKKQNKLSLEIRNQTTCYSIQYPSLKELLLPDLEKNNYTEYIQLNLIKKYCEVVQQPEKYCIRTLIFFVQISKQGLKDCILRTLF